MDPYTIKSYFSRNILLDDVVPQRLFEISLNAVVEKIQDSDERVFAQLRQTTLPTRIADKIVQKLPDDEAINKIIKPFLLNPAQSKIRSVKLKNMPDNTLVFILQHELEELDLISNCEPPENFLDTVKRYGSKLLSLTLGDKFTDVARGLNSYHSDTVQVMTLRRLSIIDAHFVNLSKFHLNQLTYLNLSCVTALGYFTPAKGLMTLKTLIMYRVGNLPECIDWIVSHSNLEVLDLSVSSEKHGKFKEPSTILTRIAVSLPKLIWLDISGTNLADTGVATDASAIGCDIRGLVSRVGNPLHYLGLYGTMHSACHRHHIPAELISGDANEQQILTAAIVNMNRIEMIIKILNDLYNSFRFDNNDHIGLALDIVLTALKTHIQNRGIQVTASATLFYIVKGREKEVIRARCRQRIIETVIASLEVHQGEEALMRNVYLILCQFQIPNDVLFVYKRVVSLILIGVSEDYYDSFVQRIAIFLLNSLACQVDSEQKEFLGSEGVINKMLSLITIRIRHKICDDVLEVAWSSMWNVTDEAPVNCERFLDANGMGFFLKCLKVFPNKDELLRNMMGLLGNVAEVQELRPRLMDQYFLAVFFKLLDSTSDGMEVSYNAAGVLAHIAADGKEKWTVPEPDRDAVMTRMENAIDRWDLNTERNINYRSFKPILRLLETYHTPQCQHWAAWALANLTTVYADKYCDLVKQENGIPLLQRLLADPRPHNRIKHLVRKVVTNLTVNTFVNSDGSCLVHTCRVSNEFERP